MAFTSQTTSSVADFISKLNTFLSAQGWTTHHVPASGEFAAEKNPSGSIWLTLATQWDTTSPQHLGIYQWHGATYNSGSSPWAQNNDSGNGAASTTNATIAGQRHINLGTGSPGTVDKFWCFEDDNYFHVVIQRGASSDQYEHFGCGILTKYNDWTGGEYCYGQAVDVTFNGDTPTRISASYLLDGLSADESPSYTNMEERCATMHIEGMNDQGGSTIWSVVMGSNQSAANLGTDRAANARIHTFGGYRGGMFPGLFGNFVGSYGRGLVPMYPIVPFYFNRTTGNPEGPLGVQPDVRGINIANFAAGDEITVGSDTWVVFPSHRRQDSGATAGYTGVQGIAYKQVT